MGNMYANIISTQNAASYYFCISSVSETIKTQSKISDADEIYVLKHRLTNLTKIGKSWKSGWVVKGTSGVCEDEIVCV